MHINLNNQLKDNQKKRTKGLHRIESFLIIPKQILFLQSRQLVDFASGDPIQSAADRFAVRQ